MDGLMLRGVFFLALSSLHLNNWALCQQARCETEWSQAFILL